MNHRHRIEQLDFNIAFTCRDAELEAGESLTGLLKQVLLPIIDEVLDRYDQPGTVLQLDALQLDLGAIPRAHFAHHIGARMRAVLEDAMARELPSAIASTAVRNADPMVQLPSWQSRDQAELDQLVQFLVTGRLPWHAANGTARIHETQLNRLLDSGAKGLWIVLAQALRDPLQARRLVTQYSESLLLSIVRHRRPEQVDEVERMLERIRKLAKTACASGVSEARAIELGWQQVLAYCLSEASTACNLRDIELGISAGLQRSAPEVHVARQLAECNADELPPTLDSPDQVLRLVSQCSDTREYAIAAQLDAGAPPTTTDKDIQSDVAMPDTRFASGHNHAADLIQLTQFLATGRLPRPAIKAIRQHEAQLARLIEEGSDGLWTVLLDALDHPERAQRLVSQYSETLLLSIVRRRVPRKADAVLDLLATLRIQAQAGDFSPLSEARAMQLGWQSVLTACLAQGEALDLKALKLRIVAQLKAGALPTELDILAQFLFTGRLPASVVAEDHETQLARLIQSGDKGLAQVLSQALDHPESALRLVSQYSDKLLRATVRRLAPRQANPVLGILKVFRIQARAGRFTGISEARARQLGWKQVLTTCLSQSGAIDVAALEQCMSAQLFASVPTMAGTQQNAADVPVAELESLMQFLSTGRLLGPVVAGVQSHEAQLARLIDNDAEGLWAVLAQALANPDSGLRLVSQYSETLLQSILRRRLMAQADAVLDMLVTLRNQAADGHFSGISEARAMQLGWKEVLTLCVSQAGEINLRARERSIRTQFAASAPCADLDEFAQCLATGHHADERGHEAQLARLLQNDTERLWPVLAQALAHPDRTERLVSHFSETLLESIVRKSAPAQADALLAMLVQQRVSGPSERHRSVSWKCILAHCLVPPGTSINLTDLEQAISAALDAASGMPIGVAASVPRQLALNDIATLANFLASSQWHDVDETHVQLFDRLLVQAGDSLTQLVADALSRPHQARRLLQQFPQQQLLALLGRAAPRLVDLPALLCQRVQAALGNAADMATIAQLVWKNVLTAAVARPVVTQSVQMLADAIVAQVVGEVAPMPVKTEADMLRALDRFLQTGSWIAQREYGNPGDALARLPVLQSSAAQSALANALRVPASARRLVQQLSEAQLYEIARTCAPNGAAHLYTLMDELRQRAGIVPLRYLDSRWVVLQCWQRALAATVEQAVHPADSGAVSHTISAEIIALAQATPVPMAWKNHEVVTAVGPSWQRGLPEQRSDRALLQLLDKLTPAASGANPGAPDSSAPQFKRAMSQAVRQALNAVERGVLSLHQRELLARFMVAQCGAVEVLLRDAIPVATPPAKYENADSLTELARQLHHGAPLQLVMNLSLPALRQLVANFIQMDRAISDQHRAIFFDSINSGAADAEDAPAYWRSVLTALVRREALDLEVVSKAECLHQALATGLATGDFVPLCGAWDALLRECPVLVRQCLLHYGRAAPVRAALTARLPQSMLREFVRLGQPSLIPLVDLAAAEPERFHQRQGAEWDAMLWTVALAMCPWPGSAVTAESFTDQVQQVCANVPATLLPELAVHKMPVPVPAAPALRQVRPCQAVILDPRQAMALNNAGLVLAAPYLPRLLDMFGLVKDGAFLDTDAAERAVHLMQFVVTGRASTPEYKLTLNKVLCGLAPDAPVAAGIEITALEQDTIEGMLKAMISAWTVLGSTSIEGLRQSFLARTGDLQLQEESWQLRVDKGPFDMLLDRLPWGFSILKFGWMPLPVHVTWLPS